MKYRMKKILYSLYHRFFFIAGMILSAPLGVLADEKTPQPAGCTFDGNWKIGDPLPAGCRPDGVLDLGTTSGNYKVDGVRNFLNIMINNILPLIGIIAVMFIVINAFKMVANAGNDAKAKEAQKGVVWASVGLLGIILSYAIITSVIRLVYEVVPG